MKSRSTKKWVPPPATDPYRGLLEIFKSKDERINTQQHAALEKIDKCWQDKSIANFIANPIIVIYMLVYF